MQDQYKEQMYPSWPHVNGMMTYTIETDCVNRPDMKTWFNLKVKVTNTMAQVYLDDVWVVDFTPHYPKTEKAAVWTWNWQNPIVFFKDFKIIPFN